MIPELRCDIKFDIQIRLLFRILFNPDRSKIENVLTLRFVFTALEYDHKIFAFIANILFSAKD